MSLSNVSTELDEAIIRQLTGHSSALAAVCGTSKYYRSLAEPILYNTTNLADHIEFRLERLLAGFLDMPQLAQHVKRFIIGLILVANRFWKDDPPCRKRYLHRGIQPENS